jgi:hypothetical protein
MHFEFLVEDESGKIALKSLVERIFNEDDTKHSFRVFSYKGVGHIPKRMTRGVDVKNRMLLNNLPRLLKGYGRSQQNFKTAVVVVVDLDTRNCEAFKKELLAVLADCNPAPMALFRIAIEEMEAWLLGDRYAVTTAYPKAKKKYLDLYKQDSICGTWELLADAIYPGGATALKKEGWPAPGRAKCKWAENIAPHVDVEANKSRSFQVFRDGVRNLVL